MSHIIEKSQPFVLRNILSTTDWEAASWSPEKLADIAGAEMIATVRFGPKTHTPGEILWETQSPRENMTMKQFVQWISNGIHKSNKLNYK